MNVLLAVDQSRNSLAATTFVEALRLPAHADQQGLMDWYHHFKKRPRVVLVHGEPEAMDALAHRLKNEYHADVVPANFQQKLTF